MLFFGFYFINISLSLLILFSSLCYFAFYTYQTFLCLPYLMLWHNNDKVLHQAECHRVLNAHHHRENLLLVVSSILLQSSSRLPIDSFLYLTNFFLVFSSVVFLPSFLPIYLYLYIYFSLTILIHSQVHLLVVQLERDAHHLEDGVLLHHVQEEEHNYHWEDADRLEAHQEHVVFLELKHDAHHQGGEEDRIDHSLLVWRHEVLMRPIDLIDSIDRMNEWMNEWMNVWMYECIHAWMHNWMYWWIHG